MSSPKVSVIIPNYNHQPYLDQRIKSVVNQTYSNLEIIILDDCSTDNSRDVIERFRAHPKVTHIIYNKLNSGSAFLQWHKGIEQAQGEWIWIAESDDSADASFLQDLLGEFEKVNDKTVGLIYADSFVMNEDGSLPGPEFKQLRNASKKTDRWNSNFNNNGRDELENWFLPHGTIQNASAVLFRADLLRFVNIFDIPMKYIGDKYAYVKMLATADVLYVSKPLNYYRNPFNTKYAARLDEIFIEQFLIFDWLCNARVIASNKFWEFFFSSARVSVYRGWNRKKAISFWRLFVRNPWLFIRVFIYNAWYPLFNR